MPIVISRKGDLLPVATAAPPERRNAAWAQIVQTWAEKNEEQFRSMLDKPSGIAAEADKEV